jgi:uncharacterized FAD-dependent dehydrogenase
VYYAPVPREVVLTLPPSEEPPATEGPALESAVAAVLAVDPDTIVAARLRRLSFDARRRFRHWRLVVDVWLRGEDAPPAIAQTPPTFAAPATSAPHVVVVGSGPAGMFCALDLLAAGLRVVVLERGRDVQTRRHALAAANRGQPIEADSNYCFGEGGAGTYSDGKLYTRAGRKDAIRAVLETLVAHGAPPDILASWRPHVGSNRLPRVVEALRETIRRSGGVVRFAARVEEVVTDGDAVAGVRVRDLDTDVVETLAADAVVLATGHSAGDAVAMAARAGARLEAKGFAMGVRIEHPQPWLDQRQYGGLRGACDLPAAFYELTAQADGRGVYSVCMCPGGFVVPASTDASRVVVNGMSLSRRDSPYANAGLVVQIDPADWRDSTWVWEALGVVPAADDDPLLGVRLQEALETRAAQAGGGANRVPAQRADAFASGDDVPDALPTSYRPGVTPTRLADVLPAGMTVRLRAALREFDRRMPGFAGPEAQMLGVESRTSSPVRVVRDPTTLASPTLPGLYPCGEGAGYAGGIVSAAIDGRRVATAVAALLAPRGAARH